MSEDAPPLLRVDSLTTGYGKRSVLNAVSLDVSPGEIVALIGPNGSGKSTLLKAIFGLVPAWQGRGFFDGEELPLLKPRMLLRADVAYVPQGGRVFRELTVSENLEVGGVALRREWSSDDRLRQVFGLFPALESRQRQPAGSLSGGERQMLALVRALIIPPRLLLLDEPFSELAPAFAERVLEQVKQISRDYNMAVLIVEQRVREVLSISHRVYSLCDGHVSFSGLVGAFDYEALRQH